MASAVEFLSDEVAKELAVQPADIRARFTRIVQLIERHGLTRVREPYVKQLEGKLWEMRMMGKDGIAQKLTARGCRPSVHQEIAEDATQ